MINYQNRIVQEDMSTIVSQSYIQWDRMTNKSVMITGANGMLATYMVYVLAYLNETQNANIKIIATARNIEKAKARFSDLSKMSNFELIKHDVTENVNYESNVDYIVHAASPASPKYYNIDPVGVIMPNILGTKNTLELARKNNIEGYLYFSSGEVYGQLNDGEVVNEDKSNILEVGKSIYQIECRICHTENGINGLKGLTTGWSHDAIRNRLNNLPGGGTPYMPPFVGTDAEKDALAAYLKSLNTKGVIK